MSNDTPAQGAPQPPYTPPAAPSAGAYQPGQQYQPPQPNPSQGQAAPQWQASEPSLPAYTGQYPPAGPQPGQPNPYAPPSPYGQQPGPYGQQPSPYGAPAPQGPGVGGLAIAAICVGAGAFLFGWVPVFGLIVALVGLVLGIIAVTKPRGKGLAIGGIVMSAIGLVVALIVSYVVFIAIPAAHQGLYDAAEEAEQWAEEHQDDGIDLDPIPDETSGEEEAYATVDGQFIDTPCWSYEGPLYFVNNISSTDEDLCIGTLELWGEFDETGLFEPSGGGIIGGQIGVEPVRKTSSDGYAPDRDPSTVVDAIAESYFAQQGGEILSLHESIELDGMPAQVTRIDSDAEGTQMKAFITVFAPTAYDVGGEQVELFIISLVTPYSNGEEQLQQIIDSWTWE